jgi:hypothetical protein
LYVSLLRVACSQLRQAGTSQTALPQAVVVIITTTTLLLLPPLM